MGQPLRGWPIVFRLILPASGLEDIRSEVVGGEVVLDRLGATKEFDERCGDPSLFMTVTYRGMWIHVRELGGIV